MTGTRNQILKASLFFLIAITAVKLPSHALSGNKQLSRTIAELDAVFERGMNEFLEDLNIETVEKSLHISMKAVKDYPENYETLWRAVRSAGYYTECALGLQIDGWEDICLRWGKKGEDMALKAQKIKPGRVEAYFWQIFCTGRYGYVTGVFTALKESIHTKLEDCMKKAYETGRSYLDYYPVVSIALFYFRLPWPLRDMDKAVMYYNEYISKAKDPWYINSRAVECAELLLSLDNKEKKHEAKRLLKTKLADGKLPKYYRDKAKRLLAGAD